MDTIYDVIILGAGPAGLSAAIYAGRGRLNTLLLEGALNSHLAQIDRQVRGQVEQTMERLVQRTKLPDKQTDPLGWAGTMNSLRQQAEETAMELIYGS